MKAGDSEVVLGGLLWHCHGSLEQMQNSDQSVANIALNSCTSEHFFALPSKILTTGEECRGNECIAEALKPWLRSAAILNSHRPMLDRPTRCSDSRGFDAACSAVGLDSVAVYC